jgi:hypothetical protein
VTCGVTQRLESHGEIGGRRACAGAGSPETLL